MRNKESYYLFQEMSKKKPFDIWLNEAFWQEWFLCEINQNQNEHKLPLEEIYFMTLLELGSTMNDLNIQIKNQLYCLVEKIASKYIVKDTQLLKTLEFTLIRQHRNKQKEMEN